MGTTAQSVSSGLATRQRDFRARSPSGFESPQKFPSFFAQFLHVIFIIGGFESFWSRVGTVENPVTVLALCWCHAGGQIGPILSHLGRGFQSCE